MGHVTKHGNMSEIMGKIQNLGRQIDSTCRKVEPKKEKLMKFKSAAVMLQEYTECIEEIIDANLSEHEGDGKGS